MKKIPKNKITHNKKRNIAFVFEALILEITKAVLEGKQEKKDKIISILKEYFVDGKPLAKILSCYRTLLETKCKTKDFASRLLSEVKSEYAFVLTNEDVYEQQGQLISKINKQVGPTVFSNFVPNYRNLASLYQIFNVKNNVKTRAILEESLVCEMCKENEKKEIIEPLDNVTFRIFLEKYNNKYSSVLNENQKKILTYYVMSFSDEGATLKSYLNEEIDRLRLALLKSKEIESDSMMQEMAGKVLQFMDSIKEKQLNENVIQKVLEIQSLVEEIKREGEENENY